MESPSSLKVGCKLKVTTKDDVKIGTCSFVGMTSFAPGKWVGVVLDDASGKNNGEVQGTKYFECKDNHGIFVRPNQIQVLDGEGSGSSSPMSQSMESLTTPAKPRSTGLRKPTGLVTPGSALKQPRKTPAASGLKGSSTNLSGSSTSLSSTGARGSSSNLSQTGMRAPASQTKRQSLLPPKKATSSVSNDSLKNQNSPDLQSVSQTSVDSQGSSTLQPLISRSEDLEEINKLRSEVKDLSEKLDTIKLKRQEDKAKMKEADKVKIIVEQLKENKTRLQESNKDLQQQLQNSKRESRQIQESYDQYRDEMSEIQETVELAALDKEMAEEKCESLVEEHSSLKEQHEELQSTVKLLRAELESGVGGASDGVSSYQVKQLEQQNERLKEALVKLRDMSNSEKVDNQSLKKQVEKLNTELSHLYKDKELRAEEIEILNIEVIDLKDQVDASLGAEDMVEKLTDKNLMLEEKLSSLEDERKDLEQINEMNEELHENAREVEVDMREQIDLKTAQLLRSEQTLTSIQLQLSDRQNTISKYRDLVQQLQEQNQSLAASGGQSPTTILQPTQTIDIKTQLTNSKAQGKLIELELLRLELNSLTERLTLTEKFIPDTYFNHGEDGEGIQLLQLIPSTISKTHFLQHQLRNKYPMLTQVTPDDVTGSQRAESASFSCYIQTYLNYYTLVLNKLNHIILNSDEEVYKALTERLVEIKVFTRPVNSYLELLVKDELSENLNISDLIKSINFFQEFINNQFSDQAFDPVTSLRDDSVLLISGADSLIIDMRRLLCMLGTPDSEEKTTINQLIKISAELNQQAKRMKHCVATDTATTQVNYSKDLSARVYKSLLELVKLVDGLYRAVKQADRDLELQPENAALSGGKVKEYFKSQLNLTGSDLVQHVEIITNTVSELVSQIETGKLDQPRSKHIQGETIIERRSQKFHKEISGAGHKLKLTQKDEIVNQLKQELRKKAEEVNEFKLRSGLADRKVTSAVKEKEDQILKLQRLVEESQNQLKKKEREFEKTMDTLQSDIDSLENEKSAIQTKLNNITKKQLYDSLSRASSGGMSREGSVAGVVSGGMDSPLLLEQIKSLKNTINKLKYDITLKQSNNMMAKLSVMKPLQTVNTLLAPPTRDQTANQIERQRNELKQELNRLHKDTCSYVAARKVSSVKVPTASLLGSEQYKSAELVAALNARLSELKQRSLSFIGASTPIGRQADMQSFIDTKAADSLAVRKVGRISIPAVGRSEVKPITVDSIQLKTLLRPIT